MEKQEIIDRINAIKNIIQASVEGEKIKSAVQADMDKKGISIPDYPEPRRDRWCSWWTLG